MNLLEKKKNENEIKQSNASQKAIQYMQWKKQYNICNGKAIQYMQCNIFEVNACLMCIGVCASWCSGRPFALEHFAQSFYCGQK